MADPAPSPNVNASEEATSPDTRAPRPDRPLLSIVIPAFNEEGCIDEMLRRLHEALAQCDADYEILFVDDGSSDGTAARLRGAAREDPRIRYLSFSRNFGHQIALTAGIDHASGDAVISLDGDLQHPPEMIPELVAHWRDGYDVVYTVRVSNEGHPIKEAVSALFYRSLRALTGVDVPTGGADFRLLDRRACEALRSCDEHYVFVRGLVPWIGFRRKAVPYAAAERYAGESKYLTGRMIRFALDGVFSFSIVPLRIIAVLGLITTALGVAYGGYSLWVHFLTDTTVSGWTSLVIVILVFSGTQLLSLGILSEYVGRTYEEVKRRPRYIVAERSPELHAAKNREDG